MSPKWVKTDDAILLMIHQLLYGEPPHFNDPRLRALTAWWDQNAASYVHNAIEAECLQGKQVE